MITKTEEVVFKRTKVEIKKMSWINCVGSTLTQKKREIKWNPMIYLKITQSEKEGRKKDSPVHQHTCFVWGLAPFHLAGFLHILEVPLCCFNITNLTKNNATTDQCCYLVISQKKQTHSTSERMSVWVWQAKFVLVFIRNMCLENTDPAWQITGLKGSAANILVLDIRSGYSSSQLPMMPLMTFSCHLLELRGTIINQSPEKTLFLSHLSPCPHRTHYFLTEKKKVGQEIELDVHSYRVLLETETHWDN